MEDSMTWIRAHFSAGSMAMGSAGMLALFAVGCASQQPIPTQQLTDIEAASRSANELGAQSNPQAQLHLKLADEQLKQAKVAMENDDELGAERLLQRAKADAELALALTHGSSAQEKAQKAVDESNVARENTGPAAIAGGTQ
jgi:hypothetical protein